MEYSEIEDQAAFVEKMKQNMPEKLKDIFFPVVENKGLESYRMIFIDEQNKTNNTNSTRETT